jgi:hypothetical protein
MVKGTKIFVLYKRILIECIRLGGPLLTSFDKLKNKVSLFFGVNQTFRNKS